MRRESSEWCTPAHISPLVLARKRAHLLAQFRQRDNECRVEFEEVFHRTEAPQSLSGCCCLRGGELVVAPDRDPGISVLRNSQLGGPAGCCHALSRISHRGHSGVDFRYYSPRNSTD